MTNGSLTKNWRTSVSWHTELKAQLAETTFRLQALRLRLLLTDKYNFNPSQPRVPRGHRFGGRWTRPGGTWSTAIDGAEIILASHEPDRPHIPQRRPERARDRNRVARRIARYIGRYIDNLSQAQIVAILLNAGWLANEAGSTIYSYLDKPRTLGELKERAKAPLPGYDVHHIVEQTPAYKDGFSREQINGDDNRVLIPRYKHWEITGWYGTSNEEYGGLSPREFLRKAPWGERVKIGLHALEKHGVLKP
ncbi:hypothetical protein [Nitratireductor pacificus]|uniref:hypothetical protein n=1 Tax=Nitratireductor pacificus TaxID=1231180 RepID=UPI0012F6E607|nr:hypothetical protein [Nitratireductor pacificus]